MTVVHLITQRGQPYGSARRCCERCGAMRTADLAYVDDEADFVGPLPIGAVRCDARPATPVHDTRSPTR